MKGKGCDTLPVNNPEPMEVVWGLQPADFNCTQFNQAEDYRLRYVCPDLFSSPIGRPFQLLWEAIFFPQHYRVTDPMPIPYHANISAEQVLDPNLQEQLTSVLTGKIVIYGARIALVKDSTYSPVHGPVDGAFIHAMAIDNLLTFGSRYIHRAAGQLTFRKESIEFQSTALMILAGLAIFCNRRRLLQKVPSLKQEILREKDEYFLRWIRGISDNFGCRLN